jgi:hypothetical protein
MNPANNECTWIWRSVFIKPLPLVPNRTGHHSADLFLCVSTYRKAEDMSLPARSLSSHVRAPSTSAAGGAQSPALLARIEEKKAELQNLKELRDLSAAVASQMEALEQKLSTLSDGTEGAPNP